MPPDHTGLAKGRAENDVSKKHLSGCDVRNRMAANRANRCKTGMAFVKVYILYILSTL